MEEIDQLRADNAQLLQENQRLKKFADEVWAECQARGEILDDIQQESGGGWWYHAKYELKRLRDELVRLNRSAEFWCRSTSRIIAAKSELLSTLKQVCQEYSDLHWRNKPINTNVIADALDLINQHDTEHPTLPQSEIAG